jgi:acyl-CoA synthetase (NDP forming)
VKSVKGGVKASEQIEAEFRSTAEIAKQHTVEQEVVAHARNTGGKIVIEGTNVVTGSRVTLKVDPSTVSSRVTDYNALPGT